MRLRRLAVTLLALLTTAASAQKRPITETDLFDFHWIGDTQLSPDGHTVAFVQANVAADRSGYETSLYTLDTATPGATPQRLTQGPHDSSPRWNGNGSQLAFVRAEEVAGKPSPPQLFLVNILPAVTAPIRISDLPKGVSNPQWGPNGQGLAVLSLTPKDPAKARREAYLKSHSTGPAAHVSDVRIVDREVYRLNGEGNLDPSLVPQLYLITLPSAALPQPAAQQITNGLFGLQEYTWVNTSWIIFTAALSDEPYYEPYDHNAIYALDPHFQTAGQQQQQTFPQVFTIADKLPFEARGLSVPAKISPTDFPAQLAFHAAASPIPPAKPVSHQETDLFTLNLNWTSGNPTGAVTPCAPANTTTSTLPCNLTGGQGYEMGGGIGGDNTAPRGGGRGGIAWSADGKHLLDVAGSQGSALLLSVDAATGAIAKLSARQQAVLSFAATPDQSTILALISNPLLIGDLFKIDPTGTPGGPANGTGPRSPGNQTQLTHVNDALFSQLDLQMPEDLHVKPTVRPTDIPFLSIDTFVQLPPAFDKTKKYPAILNIHGGPHSAYGWVFDHEMLYMAAKGYVVIYPNPRGSTTYGQQFANVIENNYPGDDFHDLMDTVDAVVAKGWADPAKLGVTGGSGGGLLTDWTVTQTNRFKAAVAQRDIVDAANWWYTADIGEFHQYWWPEAPFESQAHLDLYKKLSPLTYVNNIKTPMMFILGDADYRTPPTAGGEIFFRALKYKKIPTVMVRFPRESHELSRSGEPWHRIERLDNIVNWFDHYLMGIPEPQYNLPPTP